MPLPTSFLAYRNYRHLKLAAAGLLAATLLYALVHPLGGRSGDTWVGYLLGGVSAALVLWLLWFGVRKRRYGAGGAPLQGWLSAHVYLGATLLVLVPLHSAFQFGWNVHTLTYGLLVLVVLSGFVGVAFYALVPSMVTRDRSGRRFKSFLQEIADIDAECRAIAQRLPDALARAAALSIDETRVGRLGGRRSESDNATVLALEQVRAVGPTDEGDTREAVGRLRELLTRKLAVLHAIRRDLRQRRWMDVWLLIHVPVSLATVTAIGVHVLVVFYYW